MFREGGDGLRFGFIFILLYQYYHHSGTGWNVPKHSPEHGYHTIRLHWTVAFWRNITSSLGRSKQNISQENVHIKLVRSGAAHWMLFAWMYGSLFLGKWIENHLANMVRCLLPHTSSKQAAETDTYSLCKPTRHPAVPYLCVFFSFRFNHWHNISNLDEQETFLWSISIVLWSVEGWSWVKIWYTTILIKRILLQRDDSEGWYSIRKSLHRCSLHYSRSHWQYLWQTNWTTLVLWKCNIATPNEWYCFNPLFHEPWVRMS